MSPVYFADFATRELAVPDISMVQGRMLVCAWETGLEDVSDTAVKLIMQAIEVKRGGGSCVPGKLG